MTEISSTADQMLVVLEEIARSGPASIAELSARCDLNRTVVHRLVATLHARGYVLRDANGYALGPMIARLAGVPMPGIGAVALPAMQQLAVATGETVVLHVADGPDAVVVEQVVGDRHLVRVQHRPGSKHPLSIAASGRAILAYLPPASIRRTARRDADMEKLETELAGIRAAGYARSHDELQAGVHGLAAPIEDEEGAVTASLAILVPSIRAGELDGFAAPLLTAASGISAQLRRAFVKAGGRQR